MANKKSVTRKRGRMVVTGFLVVISTAAVLFLADWAYASCYSFHSGNCDCIAEDLCGDMNETQCNSTADGRSVWSATDNCDPTGDDAQLCSPDPPEGTIFCEATYECEWNSTTSECEAEDMCGWDYEDRDKKKLHGGVCP